MAGGGRIVIVRDAFNDCRLSSAQENITRFDEGQGTVLCLAKYEYDAWGKQLWWEVNHDSDFDVNIASINPLRYRGYVYERHTGLYYLQSRYYNPNWGRFINAESLLSTGQGVLGNNMFAYCGNNPVSLVNNLYGKAIQTAVNQGIQKAFISSSIKIVSTTIATPLVSAFATPGVKTVSDRIGGLVIGV